MRIYLCGQKHFGAAVLEQLRAGGHEIAGVSSPALGSSGPDKVRAKADLYGLPWMEAGRLDAGTLPENVDLIVAAHSHDFIGERTRLRATYGAIGYHPSLLPLHRGRDAVRWSVRLHERVVGGSVYWLTNKVDGGPIAAQDYCITRPDDTAEELWRRELSPMGVRLLAQVVDDIARGRVVRVEQDDALATWEPSFDSKPLHRPDLLQLPGPGAAARSFIAGLSALRRGSHY